MQPQDRYKTILVIVTGLLVIAKITDQSVFITAAIVVGIVSIFIAPAAQAVEWLWFKLALGLGWINSKILLTTIFFVFLLPLAWFSRWFRKDSLSLKRSNGSSIFNTRNHRYTKKDLENIW